MRSDEGACCIRSNQYIFPKGLMNFLDDGFFVVHTYLSLTQ
jgi:hypothetical protein